MPGLLVLFLLLALLFGGLAIFVAKVFLFVMVAMLLVSLLTGGVHVRRRGY
ncbi:MAG: hypothetical protein O3B31_03185 [Chloroflexi bacterium]|nr:hypothetical protein [Chloroflexota bacterium]MDA1002346.1 hypothetical protein [Chloroflexota bacterium]